MSRTLKRRSDAVTRDASSSDSDVPQPAQRRRRSATPSSGSESDVAEPDELDADTQARDQQQALVKKLVRLALATSYSRQPLRRADISTKILKDTSSARQFKSIFSNAQDTLRRVFGMELVELPSKEKTSLKDRRLQATQTNKTANPSTKSWVLVSTLPEKYKTNVAITRPSRAPSDDIESGYTALYTFIVALIYLNSNDLAEGKLERYLKRVNADVQTPVGSYEKVLQRMIREGYVERRREASSEGDLVSYTVGPRGKVEVGGRGVEGLVKAVYGTGNTTDAAVDEEDLNKRLSRSLGVTVSGQTANMEQGQAGRQAAENNPDESAIVVADIDEPRQRRSGRRVAARQDNDD